MVYDCEFWACGGAIQSPSLKTGTNTRYNENIPVVPPPFFGVIAGLSLHDDERRRNARVVPPRSADRFHVCSIPS